jgi:hypothetical protein
MQATPVRARLGSALEWFVAALFLIATIAVALLIARELRVSTPVAQAAPETDTVLPVAVPARAISVPVLLLLDGKEVRVGAEVGRQQVDRGALGDRLTRFYEYRGTRFVLVFEPFERNGTMRVAGIYLQ